MSAPVRRRADEVRPFPLAALAGRLRSRDVMRLLHISGSVLAELRTIGLTDLEADVLATSIELHPSAVWPTWWDVDADELDAAVAAGDAALVAA